MSETTDRLRNLVADGFGECYEGDPPDRLAELDGLAARVDVRDGADAVAETNEDGETPVVAFVCVRNAGRSRMAAAFAERERDRRDARVEVLSGGTDPADRAHGVVVEAMAEAGFDLSDRRPREIGRDELARADYVITMGCSAGDVCPATWRGDARDWALDDPHGRPLEEVRAIRDEIAERVAALFDELETG